MKAVILEIIKGRAVVMKADGSVTKIRNKNYSVGDEIYMKEGIFSHRRWAPIVAALLIFAMVGTGTWAYATPAYEISVINGDETEFLFSVNKLNKVIGVSEEQKEVYDPEDFEPIDADIYQGKDINQAIILMLDELGYDDDEYENLVITAIANDKAKSERVAKSLQERMDEYWAEMDDGSNDEQTESQEMGNEDKAPMVKGLDDKDIIILKEYDITPGKLNIVKNLMYIEDKEENKDYVDDYLKGLEDELEDGEELSNKIMEEFSARNGEKNNPSVNAPGQEDKEEREEKDNSSQFAPGQLKKQGIEVNENEDNDDDNDEDDMEDNDDSGRPESPGKSNEAPGQNKDKNKNNG